jgi:adenine-specific DNA-methyltransferase
MTNEGDWVLDPFLGTGSSIIAAIRHNRRGAGAEIVPKYIKLAKDRIQQELIGTLKTRPMDKPVYDPIEAGNKLTSAPWANPEKSKQILLIKERKVRYQTR